MATCGSQVFWRDLPVFVACWLRWRGGLVAGPAAGRNEVVAVPLAQYGVVKGAVVDRRAETGDTPHYQIRLRAGDTDFRCAVNIRSQLDPPDLLYLAVDDFRHPVTAAVADLPDGFTPLDSRPGGGALDFVRGNLFDRLDMRTAPAALPGPDNDLGEFLDHYVRQAQSDPRARVWAFGQRWGPEERPDKIFGFAPGNGVHDVHMNQGNSGPFAGDDGVWQDGALLLHLPEAGRWVGVFLAFASQAWHTDDTTGHTLPGTPGHEPAPGTEPPPGVDGRAVRIVAALVNPVGPAPEHETVTLLNASPNAVDLAGWTIGDRARNLQPLDGTIPPGAAFTIALAPPVRLGNDGGTISLLDAAGLKVDGVAYTAAQADREGWTIAF